MAIRARSQLRMRDGVLELVVEAEGLAAESPDAVAREARDHVLDHQAQLMTDDTLLDPPGIAAMSVLETRDVLPEPHRVALRSVGLEPLEAESGGAVDGALAGLFGGRRRPRLDRFGTSFLRLAAAGPRWEALEEALIDAPYRAPLDRSAGALSRVLREVARTQLGVADPTATLGALEQAWLRARQDRAGRWVLHPALVRALAAEAAEWLRARAPATRWDPDDEVGPLHVEAARGRVVRTDPIDRVVDFVVRGRPAALTEYVERVLRQSSGV